MHFKEKTNIPGRKLHSWRTFTAGFSTILLLAAVGWSPIQAAEEKSKAAEKEELSHAEKAAGPHYHQSSELIGDEVLDEAGNKIGSVHDLMVDIEGGQVPFVVVAFNEFLGMGGDLFAIPWSGISHNHQEDKCVLGVRKESEVPSKKDQDWIGLESDKDEGSDVAEFGLTPYWVKQDEVKETDKTRKSQLVSANELVGSQVQSQNGEEIGDISDLIIHSEDGAIASAILSMGGVAGIGDTLYPIPVSLLEERREEGFPIGADKEMILKAPAYNAETTLTDMDEEWVKGVHTHYGVEVKPVDPNKWNSFQASEAPAREQEGKAVATRDQN